MSGKITGFIREFVFAFSIILTVIGIFILFIGATAIWAPDILKDLLNLSEDVLQWNIYLLIIGFIIFMAGIWYLYLYLKYRIFILKELKTNKRSELLKKHTDLKNTVKHMPSKFNKMLKEKEEELNIR